MDEYIREELQKMKKGKLIDLIISMQIEEGLRIEEGKGEE